MQRGGGEYWYKVRLWISNRLGPVQEVQARGVIPGVPFPALGIPSALIPVRQGNQSLRHDPALLEAQKLREISYKSIATESPDLHVGVFSPSGPASLPRWKAFSTFGIAWHRHKPRFLMHPWTHVRVP